MDLLPKGTVSEDVADWLEDLAKAKKLNTVGTYVLSSKTSAGVPEAVAFIRRRRLGRDVYIVGAANVGKSAFTRYHTPSQAVA